MNRNAEPNIDAKPNTEMRPTTETVQELKAHLGSSLQLLGRLRDEIRLELHLASMDVRTRWHQEIEPKFPRAESAVARMGSRARELVDDALKNFRRFRDSLKVERSKQPSDP